MSQLYACLWIIYIYITIFDLFYVILLTISLKISGKISDFQLNQKDLKYKVYQ